MAGRIRIGISGWRYAPWRKVFYPENLTQARELHFASRVLPSIEINGSFYGLQRHTSYARWYEDTPEDFVFSIKAHRYITHILKLRDVEKSIANFLASGLFHLKEKLGPILWQFPPSFRFDSELFESFLKLLPHDTQSALELAKRREPKMHDKEFLQIDRSRPLRHAIEIRMGKRSFMRAVIRMRRWIVGQPESRHGVRERKSKMPYLSPTANHGHENQGMCSAISTMTSRSRRHSMRENC